jgi:signal transduction histidine kinase
MLKTYHHKPNSSPDLGAYDMRFGKSPIPKYVGLMLLGWIQLCQGSPVGLAGGPERPKTIVILYPDANDGRPGHVLADRGIRTTFAARAVGTVEIHSEHLDVSRFPDPSYQKDVAEFLRRKYADRKIDLVIAGLASGLDFALKHRDHVFPGVPIVFCAVDEREVKARNLPPDVIGVPIKMDMAGTLDVALRLQPAIQRVYVITGKSKFDLQWEDEARRAFQAYQDKLKFIYLAGLPLPDLLKKVADLPEGSIVYYVHLFQDGHDNILIPAEALSMIAAHAKVPIYGHVETYVGRGIVGGRVFSFESAGKNAANLGLRIIGGEKAENIGVQASADNPYMFDARELRRWGISQASLPPGSEVRHHEPTFWDLYRWQILGVVSLCVVETLLIIGLLVQRASRRRVEGDLLQSQYQLRELTGRLLLAQETERRRIARELHDDLNQSLAIVAVELDILGQKLPDSAELVQERIQKLSSLVKQLSSSMHDLSHQLHPVKLEQLGLVAALGSLCKELSNSHGLPIAFAHDEIPETLPDDAALCLYRITQECLQNAIKHSGAHHVDVILTRHSDSLGLRVVDDGSGFDFRSLDGKAGLGLASMRERLRMVDGELAIYSRPAEGTRIEVLVPLTYTEAARIALNHSATPLG